LFDKDAAVIKALAELGLHKDSPTSDHIETLQKRLDQYEQEMGQRLDPRELEKYFGSNP
jgi:hypothetical protein